MTFPEKKISKTYIRVFTSEKRTTIIIRMGGVIFQNKALSAVIRTTFKFKKVYSVSRKTGLNFSDFSSYFEQIKRAGSFF